MNNLLLSIIVPVYNREDKISECLNSILAVPENILMDIEIILVDDNSTDNSYSICTAFSEKHNIISCFKLDSNQGPGAARNYGIDIAKGDFLFFLDSDDLINTEHLEKITTALRTFPYCNIFLFHATLEGTGNTRIRKHSEISSEGIISIADFVSSVPAIPLVWQSIIRRDFLIEKHIRFFHTYYSEDIPFTASVLFFTDNIYLSSLIICRHRLGVNDSLMVNSISNRDKMFEGTAYALNTLSALYKNVSHSGWHNTLLVQLYEILFLLLGTLSKHEMNSMLDRRNTIEIIGFSEFSYSLYDQWGIEKTISEFFISLSYNVDKMTNKGQRTFFLCPACPRTIMLSGTLSVAGIKINGFLDNNPINSNRSVKWCRDNGYIVLSPEDVQEKPVVLISSNANVVRELLHQFTCMGFLKNENLISSFPKLI